MKRTRNYEKIHINEKYYGFHEALEDKGYKEIDFCYVKADEDYKHKGEKHSIFEKNKKKYILVSYYHYNDFIYTITLAEVVE